MNQELDIESKLLLLCARFHIDNEIGEKIKNLLQENIDWEYLIKITSFHGILPLLYKAINSVRHNEVPSSIISKLKSLYLKNAFRNLLLTEELIRLLGLFKEKGIDAIAYKGPILASCAYGDIAMRQFDDLDIIIGEQDVFAARDLLFKEGYVGEFQFTHNQMASMLKENNEFVFYYKNKAFPITLDLHWSLLRGCHKIAIPFEKLWESRCSHNLNNSKVPFMCVEDLFITTCIHYGATEVWIKLRYICDIAGIVNTYKQIDWKKVLGKSKELNIERTVLTGLSLAGKLLEIEIPQGISQEISLDSNINSFTLAIYKQLLNEPYKRIPLYSTENLSSLHTHAKTSFLSKFIFLINKIAIPTARDIATISLPGYLYFLYYLIRPFRLIKDVLINR